MVVKEKFAKYEGGRNMIYIPISFLDKKTQDIDAIYRGYFTNESYVNLFLKLHTEYDGVLVFENADNEILNAVNIVHV